MKYLFDFLSASVLKDEDTDVRHNHPSLLLSLSFVYVVLVPLRF